MRNVIPLRFNSFGVFVSICISTLSDISYIKTRQMLLFISAHLINNIYKLNRSFILENFHLA